jgi:hypothetical protein
MLLAQPSHVSKLKDGLVWFRSGISCIHASAVVHSSCLCFCFCSASFMLLLYIESAEPYLTVVLHSCFCLI